MKLVSSRQFGITAFLIIMAQKMFLLPTMMIKTGGQSSYISVFFVLLLEFAVLLFIMFTIRLQPNRSLYNLLDKGAGKIGGKIIAALMLFCMGIKLTLLVSELRVFFNINLGESLPDWLAAVPVCLFLFLTGIKTLRGIGRLSELTAPFILGIMVLLFLIIAGNVDFSRLLPVLGDGFSPVMKNVALYPLWFGDIPYMLIFLGQVKKDNKFFLYAPVGAGLGGIIALVFSTVLFIVFGGIPHLLDYGNNISGTLLYSASSYVFGRYDLIIFSVWIFTLFIQLALVFHLLTRNLKYIFGVKDNSLISLLSAVFVYVMIVFIFREEHLLYHFGVLPVTRISTLFNHYLVPLFVFIVAIVLKTKQSKRPATELKPNFNTGIRQRKARHEV